MKRLLTVVFLVFFAVGCSNLASSNGSIFGKFSKKQAKISNNIDSLDVKASQLNHDSLEHIGAWAGGTDLALQKTTNKEPAIDIAKETNQRVIALAGKPNYQELQEIYKLVNTYLTNQNEASKILIEKDKEINKLSTIIETTKEKREQEIQASLSLASANAMKADSYKSTLDKMDSFFGFGAIWYGIKKLVTKLAWTIGIGLVLFIILRFAAAANPIAGAIFSVFEQVVSWFIHAIAALAPKATQVAGFIEQKVFNEYKDTLTHIIDAVQMAKEKEKNGETIGVTALTKEIAASMDQKHKDCVTEIKRGLNWR